MTRAASVETLARQGFTMIKLNKRNSTCLYTSSAGSTTHQRKSKLNTQIGLFHFISIPPLLRSTNYVLGGYLVDVLGGVDL